MPTRILRDWTDSARVDGISAEAERLFVRLLMKADDFGRFHADARLIRSACFPFSESIKQADVTAWLVELKERGLVYLYKVGAQWLLAIPNFGQRVRAEVSKFQPPEGEPMDWSPPTSRTIVSSPPTNGSAPPTIAAVVVDVVEGGGVDEVGTRRASGKPERDRVSYLKGVQAQRFEAFYALYPRKVDRGAAEKAWASINPSEALALQIVEALRSHQFPTEARFIKHPGPWLNARCWEDEADTPADPMADPEVQKFLNGATR